MTTGPSELFRSAGGWSQPWTVLRPIRIVGGIPRPTFRGTGKFVHFIVFAAYLAFYLPVRSAWDAAGPIAGGAVVAGLLGLIALFVTSLRSMRLEWDGQQVVVASLGSRRVIGSAGRGRIIRAGLKDDFGAVTVTQYWMDADDRVLGRLTESQWDAGQLGALVEQTRIPVTDAGELTDAELSKRFPSTIPRVLGMQVSAPPTHQKRPRSDAIKLWGTGTAIVAVFVLVAILVNR